LKAALTNELIRGRGHTVVVFDGKAEIIGNDPLPPSL
jgi:hypothetical protein